MNLPPDAFHLSELLGYSLSRFRSQHTFHCSQCIKWGLSHIEFFCVLPTPQHITHNIRNAGLWQGWVVSLRRDRLSTAVLRSWAPHPMAWLLHVLCTPKCNQNSPGLKYAHTLHIYAWVYLQSKLQVAQTQRLSFLIEYYGITLGEANFIEDANLKCATRYNLPCCW